MGAQGTATLNFGAFPGTSDTSVAVTGQTGILAGSLVEAWLFPTATADHSADEHMLEPIRVVAGDIVAATGFTIYGFNASQINEPARSREDEWPSGNEHATGQRAGPGNMGPGQNDFGGHGTRVYGQWTVAWVWA
jgi:hypothetical protein